MLATIAAVSARKIFFDKEIGVVFSLSTINCLSFSEKSPSGPTKRHNGLWFVEIVLIFLFLQLISQK